MISCKNYDKLRYAIIGFPWDVGSSLGRPGSRYAPKMIRESLTWLTNRIKNDSVYDLESNRVIDLSKIVIEDFGDIEITSHDTLKTFENAYNFVKKILRKGFKPIVLGGDHSVSYPCIKALDSVIDNDLVIIQFDAHLDLLDESPNQGRFSHSSQIRRALELEKVKKVIQIGVRGYNYPHHYNDIKKYQIHQITPHQIRKNGIEDTVERITDFIKSKEHVYTTVDIDVLDPSVAPGSGANEPGGLTFWELNDILKRLAPITDSLDVTEVNPLFDPQQTTTSIAAKLIFDFIIYASFPPF